MDKFTSKSSSFPYLYRGIVKINSDPNSLGRCKIHIPDLYGKDDYNMNMLPWARPILPSSYTSSKGAYVIPDIGDIVWVFLEGGNKSAPVYIGGTVGTNDSPIDTTRAVLYQEEESTIYYDRNNKSFTIKVRDNYISISEDGILINGSQAGGGGNLGMDYDIIEEVDYGNS